MSCPNRSSQNWDQTFNASQFNPNLASTPRRAASPQRPPVGYVQMKPQRLFSSEQYSQGPYQPNYSRTAGQVPYPGQVQGPLPSTPPPSLYQQPTPYNRQRPPNATQQNQVYTRKVIYESSNIGSQPSYPSKPSANNTYYNQQSPDDRDYMDASYSNPEANRTYYRAPKSSSQTSAVNKSRSTSPKKQGKTGCPPSCSPGADRVNKLYKEYMDYLQTMVAHAVIRRKRMRAAIEQTIKWTEEDLDCREKRAQKRAKTQMEDNFHQEVLGIYNDLMNRRKQLYHETRNSRSSLVSINARRNKNTPYASSLNQTELQEEEKELAEEFTRIVAAAINEFSAKDIELSDEFTSMVDTDADSDTVSAYQQEYQKETELLEEEFLNIWEQYETEKCSCGGGEEEEEDPMLIEIGNTLVEVMMQQYKIHEDLERRLADECTDCQSSKGKNYPHSDRVELNNIHVNIINDLWYAMDTVKDLLNENESSSGDDNYVAICRVLLAIYRKCLSQVKDMLQEHYKKRRAHQVENLSCIFDDEWSTLRKETNDEVQAIIDSLNKSSTTNMNCQERRLKKQQDAERENLVKKYQTERDTAGCQRGKQNANMKKALSALEKTHNEQWAMILLEKMQRKVEQIDSIYPKESKEVCVQTCCTEKPEPMDAIDEECGCAGQENETSTSAPPPLPCDNHNSNSGQSKSESDIKACTKKTCSQKLPDLNQLAAIEVNEMKELQKNLRQWQLARRSLMESINESFKQQ